MNSTYTAFGKIIKSDSALGLLRYIEHIFCFEANLFSVSGYKYPQSTMSIAQFNSAIERNGIDNVESITMYYCSNIKYPNDTKCFSATVFLCEEKSYLVIAYNSKHFKHKDHAIVWTGIKSFMSVYYGFWTTNLKFDASLYGTGMYVYANNAKKQISSEVLSREKFWIMNYEKAKNGLLRDVYFVNILNLYHLNNRINDVSSLFDIIKLEKIGRLDKLDDLFIWNFDKQEDLLLAKSRLSNSDFLLF